MNYETSESVKAIAPALVAAQAVVGGAHKSAENPHFKNKFAPLEEVWAAAKPALVDNKLAITQHPVSDDSGKPGLRTVIWHESGEWIASTIFTAPEKNNAQGVGSVMTYLRRYSLQSVLGICPEDDDGNAASTPTTTNTNAPATTNKLTPLTSEELEKFGADLHFADDLPAIEMLGDALKARGLTTTPEDKPKLLELWEQAKARRATLSEEIPT